MDIQIDYGAIGKRIRAARMKMSMTQETLSNLIDVSPTYISTIENGHTKLSLPTLISIALLLKQRLTIFSMTTSPSLFPSMMPI